MHAVARIFTGTGARELFDLIESRKQEVESLIREVPGFRGYVVFRTGDGGVSVTICDDKAGTDESSKAAAEWIRERAGDLDVQAPDRKDGEVILSLM
jgi:hypothetical protein